MARDRNITRHGVEADESRDIGYTPADASKWPTGDPPADVEEALDARAADAATHSLVDGTRAFTGTVGGVEPVANSDLATKEYVDTSAGFHFNYFQTDTASDIGGYFDMIDMSMGEIESSHTLAAAGGGDGQLIASFATPPGEPGVLSLAAGPYDFHFHAERTAGTRSVRMYWELYKRILAGTETLLDFSEMSGEITDKAEQDLHLTLGANVDFETTDRLVLKVYANLGTGSPTTVVLYQEGTTDSHITIGVDSSVLNNIFVRKNKTFQKLIYIENPQVGDDYPVKLDTATAITITEVWSKVNAATSVTFNLYWRSRATFFTSPGTRIVTTDPIATTSGETTTAFDDATLVADSEVFAVVSAVSGSPTKLGVIVEYTID